MRSHFLSRDLCTEGHTILVNDALEPHTRCASAAKGDLPGSQRTLLLKAPHSWSRGYILWVMGARLRGEHDAGNAARVREPAARDLGRVQDARLQQVLHAVLHLRMWGVLAGFQTGFWTGTGARAGQHHAAAREERRLQLSSPLQKRGLAQSRREGYLSAGRQGVTVHHRASGAKTGTVSG